MKGPVLPLLGALGLGRGGWSTKNGCWTLNSVGVSGQSPQGQIVLAVTSLVGYLVPTEEREEQP